MKKTEATKTQVKLNENAPVGGRRAMGEPEATRVAMNINRDIRKGWTVLPVTEVSKVNG